MLIIKFKKVALINGIDKRIQTFDCIKNLLMVLVKTDKEK